MSMFLAEKHGNFLGDIFASSKIDKNPYSSIPTLIFLSGTFISLYVHFHQYQSYRWREGVYKDVVFHWAYFYIVRVWFLFIKLCKFFITSMDTFVEENSPKDEIILNQTLTHFCIFVIATSVSLIPFVILCFQQLSRDHIPNMFMWITEEPRNTNEIGTSIQYLERPPHFLQKLHNNNTASYRSKRSTSFAAQLNDKQTSNFRVCKSMMTLDPDKFRLLTKNK